MVAGDALGAHRAEVGVHPRPEVLQPHDSDASAASASGPGFLDPGAQPGRQRSGAYAGGMFPSTGSSTLDRILEIAIIVVLVVSIVLLYRNYRGR